MTTTAKTTTEPSDNNFTTKHIQHPQRTPRRRPRKPIQVTIDNTDQRKIHFGMSKPMVNAIGYGVSSTKRSIKNRY